MRRLHRLIEMLIEDITYTLDCKTARLSRRMMKPVPPEVRDRMTRYKQSRR